MTAMTDLPEPPYLPDTKDKGWRFEIDLQQVQQSDTWALALPEIRPWLLMLWVASWQQVPCGSMPSDDKVIAARIGMSFDAFMVAKDVLMRGWYMASDGRLYHKTVTERVIAMLDKKKAERDRQAVYRAAVKARKDAADAAAPVAPQSHYEVSSSGVVTRDKHVTNADVTRDTHGTNVGVTCEYDTSTGTSTSLTPKDKNLVGQNPPDESDSQAEGIEPASPAEPDAVQAEFALTAEHLADAAAAEPSAPDVATGILEYLNEKAGRNYEPVDANLKLIRGRLAESTPEKMRAVIDAKVSEWGNDPKMDYCLRPKTLFNATNFANYVGALHARVPAQSAPPKSRHDLSGMDYSSRRTDGMPF